MKTAYVILLLALAFSPSAFSQTDSSDNRPQAYLFSSGGKNPVEKARPKTAYLFSSGDAGKVLTRPRVYRDASPKAVKETKTTHAFDLEKKAFELINRQRARLGLESLKWSDDAARIARLHSSNMASHSFFSHTGLDGSLVNDRADSFGVSKWQAIGENIAYNQGFENPVEFAVERWMLSPKHRENLLNSRWQESGIGIAVTENGAYYFTEVFLARK